MQILIQSACIDLGIEQLVHTDDQLVRDGRQGPDIPFIAKLNRDGFQRVAPS